MYGKTGKDHPAHGRHHTEEEKEKISRANSGENHPMYGKTGEENPFYDRHHTGEVKEAIGRASRGEGNGMAKLTEKKVKVIKHLLGSGQFTYEQIGRMYGVSSGAIGKIARDERWSHVTVEDYH